MGVETPLEVTLSPEPGRVYKVVIPEVAKVSKDTIDSDIATHSARFVWYAVLAAQIKTKRDKLADDLAAIKATLDTEARTLFDQSGTKTTEAKVAAVVEMNPKFQSMKRILSQAEEELAIANAIKDAFYHRKDMLVTLGANLRAEMDAELRINKKEVSSGR